MRFIDYLQTIYVGGLVDSCKIDCKKIKDKIFLDCEAIDTESTMKLESSFQTKIKGLKPGDSIAIFDLALLINMLSYSEEDSDKDKGNVWIANNELYYEGFEKRVEYKLADPDLIDKADIGKTIGDFLDEEQVEFNLNATHMRELIKGLSIISADYIRIYTDDKIIKAEIGDLNKLTIKVDKFKKLDPSIKNVTVYLDSRNIGSILRTALSLKGIVRFAIKKDYPAVIKIENIGDDLQSLYLVSPRRIEE